MHGCYVQAYSKKKHSSCGQWPHCLVIIDTRVYAVTLMFEIHFKRALLLTKLL